MKIIANYLPQYHRIPENDKWWGEGFTDWVSCKNAKPLFENHMQPKTPLNNNYYSLDNVETIRWQAKLAKKYGISGFGIYHYWFHSDLNILTTPPTLILENTDIDIDYFFIWDNKSWKKTWSALTGGTGWTADVDKKTQVLAELRYEGEEEWEKHFQYFLPFFKDTRYLKKNGKPILALFCTFLEYETIVKMIDYWDKRAKECGFNGVEVLSRDDYKQKQFKSKFRYTPFAPTNISDYLKLKIKRILGKQKIKKFSYDALWKEIIRNAKRADSNTILSGFVMFDDTPRRGNNGNVVLGDTPEKFYHYLKKLVVIAKKKENDFILLTAWNEWGEGCYLEPDVENGYAYLEAVKKVADELIDINE